MLPGSDVSFVSLPDNNDLVSHFHAGNAGYVYGGEIHADVADDGGVIVLDNDSSTGRKLAIQSIAIAHREHCDLGRELSNITAAVAYRLACGNFPDLNDPGFPGKSRFYGQVQRPVGMSGNDGRKREKVAID